MNDMMQTYEFLKEAKTYFIATCDGDQPKLRPFGTCNIFEDKMYIQTGRVKDCAKQMLANPKTEIVAMNAGKWIRITAELVPDDRIEAQQSMLDSHPSLQRMYKAGDGNTLVLYLKNAKVTINGGGGEPVKLEF